jgi:hypothetical protein
MEDFDFRKGARNVLFDYADPFVDFAVALA